MKPTYIKGMQTEAIVRFDVRSIDAANRTVDFVVSDTSLDRYNTVVKGWILDSYVRNPVVLFGHDSRSLPVGRALATNEVNGELVAKLQFAPAEVYDFADQVFRMIEAGYLNAVSAGFIPGDVEFNAEADAFMLTQNELIEISVVPVPANRNALKKAIGDGQLISRGWSLPDEGVISPEEATAEARAALEAWCSRGGDGDDKIPVEEPPAEEPPVEEPPPSQEDEPTSEVGRAFFAAHLAIRDICRAFDVELPDGPEDYGAAVAGVTEATAKPADAFRELATILQQHSEQLDSIEIAISELAATRTPSAPDTGATKLMREILDRANRLAG